MNNVDEILLRLRWSFGVKTDVELANFLQIPYKTLVGWKTRNSIPSSRLKEIANKQDISLDWILKGDKSTMSNNQNSVIIGGNNSGNIVNGTQTEVSPELMEVIRLYKEYGNSKILEKFKNEILKIKEVMGK